MNIDEVDFATEFGDLKPVDILAKYANGEKLEVGSLYRALDTLCSSFGRLIAQKNDIFMCVEKLNNESRFQYQKYKFLSENGDIFTFCYDPSDSFCEKVNL